MRRTLYAVAAVLLVAVLPGCGGERQTPPLSGDTGAVALSARSEAKGDGTKFDAIFRAALPTLQFPGLAVAVLKGKTLVWSGAYGYADIQRGRRMTEHTPFQIASIGKMITATALMQLWEKGKFGLDDDVGPYLPFPVQNPSFPDVPITFRMLLGHASSITDNYDMFPYIWVRGRPPPPDISMSLVGSVPLLWHGPLMTFGEYVNWYFNPSSPGWAVSLNWGAWTPGTIFSYSNLGFDLAGYLVQRISGMPFEEYVRHHIFEPLGMTAAYWWHDLRQYDPATLYYQDPTTQRFISIGDYDNFNQGAGTARTDVESLARFFAVRMHDGKIPGHGRLLRPETIALMRTSIVAPDAWFMGLGVFNFSIGIGNAGTGIDVAGHEGGDIGVYSWAFLDEARDVSVIVLANVLPSPSVFACDAWPRCEGSYYQFLYAMYDEGALANVGGK